MPLAPVLVLDTFSVPRQTQTAGTPIIAVIPPRRGFRTKLTYMEIVSGSTVHTWYFQRELGRTQLFSAAAGGATALVLKSDLGLYSQLPEYANRGVTPSTANNGIAANDYIVLQTADGLWMAVKVTAAVT